MNRNHLLMLKWKIVCAHGGTPRRERHWTGRTTKAMGVLTFGNATEWDFVMHKIVWC